MSNYSQLNLPLLQQQNPSGDRGIAPNNSLGRMATELQGQSQTQRKTIRQPVNQVQDHRDT